MFDSTKPWQALFDGILGSQASYADARFSTGPGDVWYVAQGATGRLISRGYNAVEKMIHYEQIFESNGSVHGGAIRGTKPTAGNTSTAKETIYGSSASDIVLANGNVSVLMDGSKDGTANSGLNGGNDIVVIGSNNTSQAARVVGGTGDDFVMVGRSIYSASGNFLQQWKTALNGLNYTDAVAKFESESNDGRTAYRYNVNGGDGNDTVIGSESRDYINGGMGNNALYGKGGNDNIYGGSMNDYIDGGNGIDIIDAGSGNDTIYGGAGNDQIDGHFGDDIVYGGAGNDNINTSMNGRVGRDTVYGGDGNDTVGGGAYGDKLFGEAGNDIYDLASNTQMCEITELAGQGTDTVKMTSWSRAQLKFGIEAGTNNVLITNLNDVVIAKLVNTLFSEQVEQIQTSDGLYSLAGIYDQLQALVGYSADISGVSAVQHDYLAA